MFSYSSSSSIVSTSVYETTRPLILSIEFAMSGREPSNFDIGYNEIDFKGINETYGHATGDNVLRSISNVLKTVCAGRSDFLARMTADKFVIVCRRKHEDDIGLVAKEITSGLSKTDSVSNGKTLSKTKTCQTLKP